MVLDRDKLKKLLKEKGVKSLDDFNAFMRDDIESVHRKIKKVSKNKAIFPNEQALFKLVYLAVEEAAKKWTMRHRDCTAIYSQLIIFFQDRLAKYA